VDDKPTGPPPASDEAGRKPRKPKAKPPRFAPDPGIPVEPDRWCNARTKAADHHLCDLRAGAGTDHKGTGRCRRHGGNSLVRTGATSKIHQGKARIMELVAEFEASGDSLLDLRKEVAVLRALYTDFIERYEANSAALLAWYESQLRGGDAERPRRILDIADAGRLVEAASRVIKRLEDIRAANAVSWPELLRYLSEMVHAAVALIDDEELLKRLRDAWAAIRH
jgi:hypothetical protein